jgi:signal transduction histidine kinase
MSSNIKNILQVALLAVLYFVLGKLSFSYVVSFGVVTSSIFLPEGVALAFVLMYGARIVPGVFIGQLALALTSDLSLSSAILISLSNSVEILIAYWIFHKIKFDITEYTIKNYLILIGVITLVLQPFSAAMGLVALSNFEGLSSENYLTVFSYWWAGNTIAQILLTPLILVLRSSTVKQRLQVLLAAPILSAVYYLALVNLSAYPFFIIPLLIILNVSIIIRYNVVGAAITSFVLSAVAQFLVSTGTHIFMSDNIHQELFQLNSFIIASSISFMMIGVFIRQLQVLNLRLEHSKNEAKQALSLMQQMKTNQLSFIDMIIHEYRTPLAIIRGEAELIRIKSGVSKDQLLNRASSIINASDRLESILKTGKSKVDIETALLKPNVESFNLHDVIEKSIDEQRALNPKRDIEFVTNVRTSHRPASRAGVELSGDKGLIKIAVTNLISNAIKYSKDHNEVIVELNDYELTITDQGIGIGKNEQAQIFTKHFRSDTSNKIKGSGVGLYLVDKILKQHQASIQVNSKLNEGTQVVVRFNSALPIVKNAKSATGKKIY